jgi:hypothetical protein
MFVNKLLRGIKKFTKRKKCSNKAINNYINYRALDLECLKNLNIYSKLINFG